jgi:tetraacyldisaccharide 4'-kinase
VKILRYILFPVVPIYYVVTWLRDKLYDLGIKSSKSYDFPVICVGNLSVGGTGKTPMIEYLIRLLHNDYKIATLSRGYKRNTRGFVVADATSDASSIGDEPFQFYKKFNDIIVSVDADRQNGIARLRDLQPQPNVILLDDAFQHRKVKAGFNILLTSYGNLFTDDWLLPTGNLREPKSGAKRANVIIVTKCPNNLSESEKKTIVQSIQPLQHQSVFFSNIVYSKMVYNLNGEKSLEELKSKPITLVTGIANAQPLVEYLKSEGFNFEHLNFKDHHEFSENDIQNLKSKQFILTTEKDYVRLQPHFANDDQLYYLPIETQIDNDLQFQELIKNYLK